MMNKLNYIESYKLFESGDNLASDAEYIKMLLADIEDDNRHSVNCTAVDRSIVLVIEGVHGNPYVIQDELDLQSKLDQVLSILDYKVSDVNFNFAAYKNKITRFILPVNFKSLDDYKVSNEIKHFIGNIYVDYSIFEPGMGEWMDDMMLDKISNGVYYFKSDLQEDDFEVEITEDELDTDVRLPIKSIVITLKSTRR